MTGSTKPSRSEKRIPYIIGVAGGSGSGKTYFAQELQRQLGSSVCDIIYQDNFYFDQSKKFDFDGGSVNFDHPNSIDFELLGQQLVQLKSGQPTNIPIYDFVTHSRRAETIHIEAKPIIIVDGILIFHADAVRIHFDDLVFFDTPEKLRFDRRLERDVKERGREPEGVKNQFLRQVKPMHDTFVEPSKAFAKTVVREVEEFDETLQAYCGRISKMLSEK